MDLEGKTPNIGANVSSFPGASSSNSHDDIIHCFDFPPRVLIYPLESSQLFSIASLEVKEEEVSIDTHCLSFPLLLEVEEVKDIIQSNPNHSVNNFSFHGQSTFSQLVIPQRPPINQAPPPLIQMAILGCLLNKYTPLDLTQPLNSMP